MALAFLTLFTGLAISAVAIYYSVLGLAAIFAAAVVPIIVMGTILEVAKLVTASWLKQNWNRTPFTLKAYLSISVIILMLITSMGIFGFLSKAHSESGLVSGDVIAKISVYDEKIKISKDNIDANRKALKQMDEAVDQVMGRSSDEKGADKAVAIRKSQQKERARLLSEIQSEQTAISKLNEERAPIAAEVRKVEAEVGPIKYIAAFIYGATDETILEKAVTWVIMIIVFVFDPLAVLLLLAAQMSFQWAREKEELVTEGDSPRGTTDVIDTEPPTVTPIVEAANDELNEEDEQDDEDIGTCYKCDTALFNAPGIGPFCPNKECDVVDSTSGTEIEFTFIPPAPVVNSTTTDIDFSKLAYLNDSKSFWTRPIGWEPVPPQVYRLETPVAEVPAIDIPDMERPGDYITPPDAEIVIEHIELDPIDEEIIEDSNESDTIDLIEAKRLWKEANPDDSLKHQRKLLESGMINYLPWEVEPFLKKKSITYMEKVGKDQVKKEISEE